MMGDYEYLQQRASLHVDVLSKTLRGTSELILGPKVSHLSTVRVHARQVTIQKVWVNEIECEFEHLNFLGHIVDEEYRDLQAFDLFYRGSIVASKEGELVIHLPSKVKFELQCEPPPVPPNVDKEQGWDTETLPSSKTDFKPITVKIQYELVNPKGGLIFAEDNSSPHAYTYSGPMGGLCDGARTWLPCRDTLRDVCPFKLEFIVPEWCTVVCGGTLVNQFIAEKASSEDNDDDGIDNRLSVYRYVIDQPTNASSIGFAVGPFREYVPPSASLPVSYYCLPEVYSKLVHTTRKTVRAIEFFEKWLRFKYPFKSYRQVFVQHPPDKLQGYAGASILDQALLHDETVVDLDLECHLVQVEAFVTSWISAGIVFATTKDAWFLIGFVKHLVNIYVRTEFGEEEYGFRIQAIVDALTTLELLYKNTQTTSPALVTPEVDVYAEYLPESKPFFEVKAPLFVHMVEQRVGKKHFRTAVRHVVSGADIEEKSDSAAATEETKDEADAEEGEAGAGSNVTKSDTALSVYSFLRDLKSIAGSAGQDLLKSFFTTWAVQGGMAFFRVGFWYNRKQTQAEVVLRQEVPPGGKLYVGNVTITIVEDSGEFTYVRRVDSRQHKFDFSCHSKVRKKRRKRQGLTDPDDSVNVDGPGMGLNDTPVYWVTVDVKCEWMRHVVMSQPDFNCMEQLLSDSNSMSRFSAARTLSLYPRPQDKENVMSCRALTECVSGLSTHSHRLRAEATLALGMWQAIHAPLTTANTDLPIWVGMRNLIRVYKDHFFDRETQMPLPNYFLATGGRAVLDSLGGSGPTASTNVEVTEYAEGEYEVKKTVPKACVLIRSKNKKSPSEMEQFLLQLLRENDNSKNYVRMGDRKHVVDDAYYIGTLILSLSKLNPDRPLMEGKEHLVVKEVLRYFWYDKACPGYQNIVACCSLEALCNFQIEGRFDGQGISYHNLASPSFHINIRKAAIESLIRLYFNEDFEKEDNAMAVFEGSEDEEEAREKSDVVFGPAAAFQWVIAFIRVEKWAVMRHFAAQALLDACHGFPPRAAAEALATSPHAHLLSMMEEMKLHQPMAFVNESPVNCSFAEMFAPSNLDQFQEKHSTVVKEIAEDLWQLANTFAALEQRLRITLLQLYRHIWGTETPPVMLASVKAKELHWAGGYDRLKNMIEQSESRNAMLRSPVRVPKTFSNDTSSLNNFPGLAELKGKNLTVKLKLGNDLVRSHKL